MAGSIEAYNVVDRMPDNLPTVRYPRLPGYRPEGDENQYNAWYCKTRIQGAAGGKLEGKTVALKDNVMLAGVPMMNGAATLEGYVPDVDATIVERLLDAGATIEGKAHCENFCLSGGSHTNATGPRAQPAPDGLLRGRFVIGLRGPRRGRGSGHGGRRRPGRFDTHARRLLRHLRHEADARARPLYRNHADRDLRRPHRPHDRQRPRQRADAGGDGGPRRDRSEAVRRRDPRLFRAPGRRRSGHEDRGPRGRLRTPETPRPTSTRPIARRPTSSGGSAQRLRGSRFRCTRWGPRSGPRSVSRA